MIKNVMFLEKYIERVIKFAMTKVGIFELKKKQKEQRKIYLSTLFLHFHQSRVLLLSQICFLNNDRISLTDVKNIVLSFFLCLAHCLQTILFQYYPDALAANVTALHGQHTSLHALNV